MALSEIEKLERRYAENPQGLTFAPLAEVHRKNGEVQRALDLLGPGLEIHPNYIPASIVLGRCHMDLGDVHAAETAFLHVLDLDGENVIALKALADISERLLKFDEADRWLQTLLSVDRSNDEAREQLQRVDVARRQAEVASSAEPSSLAEEQVDIAPPPLEGITPKEEPEVVVGMELDAPSRPEEPVALDESVELDASVEFEQSLDLDEEVEPIAGLVGREVDAPDDSLGDFRVEMSEDIVLESAGGSEFQVPDASQELSAWNARPERAPFEEDAPVASEPIASELVASERFASEFLAPEPPEPEPTPPAQGDFGFMRRDQDRDATRSPAPPKRAYSVGETGGRSVAHLFKSILSARPPMQASAAPVRPAPAADSAGAPTRPAADALSLSSVFGEEASETPPAVPATNQGTGSVSFDDFFTSPSASPARTTRSPDPKNDDLDQFHAWLQNLKR